MDCTAPLWERVSARDGSTAVYLPDRSASIAVYLSNRSASIAVYLSDRSASIAGRGRSHRLSE